MSTVPEVGMEMSYGLLRKGTAFQKKNNTGCFADGEGVLPTEKRYLRGSGSEDGGLQALPLSRGSVAEWLACWTQAQKAQVQIAVATLSGKSLRQTAHTHCVSVHQAAKLVAALLRVAGVTAGLAESNGSIPPGL